MRILGVDPGTATTGFGLIEESGGRLRFLDAGIISTPAGDSLPSRLATIHAELSQLIAEQRPDLVAVELLFFAKNVTTALSVGHARGVILLAASQAGVEVTEFTPLQVKLSITGYGRAVKSQIQDMVKTLLGLSDIPRPDDAADALAIAITCAQTGPIEVRRA